ncbi:MAG: glycosyltransferase family A protein [Ignavibacteria bacterium]|jgi:glycosyltransferase involved in cell wall biosynthesis
MPVKNEEQFVLKSVQSILLQTYKNFEFIIIDDGSTDKTFEILESIKDERIKLFKRESSGLIEQLNFGLNQAKGEFIARMDADDLVSPEKLETQIDFLLNNNDIHLVGTNFYFIDEIGRIVMQKNLPELHKDIEFMMPFIDSVLHSSILTYKKVLLDSGGYDKEYYCAEDDELFLRLLSLGYKTHNIQKHLYKYRLVKRPQNYYDTQKVNYYKCGLKYMENCCKEKNGEYYLRMGLLEYYRGSIKNSRMNLLKCLKFGNIKKKFVLRYLPLTFLGENIVNFLRKKEITSKVNSCVNKIFKFDTYRIEGSKVIK